MTNERGNQKRADDAAYALDVVRRIDWAKLRRDVDEKLICLSAVCSDKLDQPDVLKGAMARDLVLPTLKHIIAFCECVKIEESEDDE